MKIIDEKGKLFGIINVVDLLIVVLVIAVIGVFAVKLLKGNASEIVAAKVDCYMTVEVYGAFPGLYNEVTRQGLVGEKLIANGNYQNAEIVDVQLKDYVVSVPCDDGHIALAVDPQKKDIVITIKTQIAPDVVTPMIAGQECRAGRAFIVKTQAFETNSSIISLDIQK